MKKKMSLKIFFIILPLFTLYSGDPSGQSENKNSPITIEQVSAERQKTDQLFLKIAQLVINRKKDSGNVKIKNTPDTPVSRSNPNISQLERFFSTYASQRRQR